MVNVKYYKFNAINPLSGNPTKWQIAVKLKNCHLSKRLSIFRFDDKAVLNISIYYY